MSDYTYSANLAAKDNLASGDTNKKILGATLETEFEAIETAIASKVDEDATGYTEDTTPDPDSDFIVSYDASASGPKKVQIGRAGSWRHLQTNAPSGAATSDFDNVFTSTYDTYVLVATLTVATDDVHLALRVGTGATPTYQTSAYVYALIYNSAASETPGGEGSTSASITDRIVLTRKSGAGSGVGNAANENFIATIWIHNPSSTSSMKRVAFQGDYANASGVNVHTTGSGAWTTGGTAVTSIRVLASSGNISGTISLFGVAKA